MNKAKFILGVIVMIFFVGMMNIIVYNENQKEVIEETTIEEETTTSTIIETAETEVESSTNLETTTEESTTEETTTEEEITTTEELIEETAELVETTEYPQTQAETEPIPEIETPAPPLYNFTPEEEELLTRVAYAECRSCWEAQALVMNVILNRARAYGVSIRDIIYSPGQFVVVENDYMFTLNPTPDVLYALGMVRQGWDMSQGALYFCTPSHNKWHASHLTYLFTAYGCEWYR